MAVRWSDLPGDLLERIATLPILNLIEYIRFRAVCVSWRSSTVDPHNHKLLSDKLPWAIHFVDDDDDGDIVVDGNRGDIVVTFLRLSDWETFEMSVPEVRGHQIIGSTDGWPIMIDVTIPAVRLVLVNPITRSQIHLPPLASPASLENEKVSVKCCSLLSHELGKYVHIVDKLVLSEDRTFVVVYISLFRILAFVRPGDKQWTAIHQPPGWQSNDILHYKGSFYAVNDRGSLAICNLESHPALLTPIASAALVGKKFNRWCLATSSSSEEEDLLLIARCFHGLGPSPRFLPRRKFCVFRLDPSNTTSILLEEMKSLGDRILFWGTNQSLCLSAKDSSPGYKPNSICITNTNYFRKSCEFGFYNLEEDDGCFHLKHLERRFKSLTWFTPRLC